MHKDRAITLKEAYFEILWLSLLSKERPRSRHLRVAHSMPKDDKGKSRKRKKEPPLMVKEECNEVSVSSKRLAKKGSQSVFSKKIKKK